MINMLLCGGRQGRFSSLRFHSNRLSLVRRCSTEPRIQINSADLVQRTPNLNRLFESHRLRSFVSSPIQKTKSFDHLWEVVLSNPSVNIETINRYLFLRLACGLDIDSSQVLESLKLRGLHPTIRTYGAFIEYSCSKGDMDQTNSYIQALKEERREPDAFIFSRILYGYTKAKCFDEVEETKQIMARKGLWPSSLGYGGLLLAHAEMGDYDALVETLNEALDSVRPGSHRLSNLHTEPFSTNFLINLYVKLTCAQEDHSRVCWELLNRLPVISDEFSRSLTLTGVKRLLAGGRLLAAQELFKRADPHSVGDGYLVSLPEFLFTGGNHISSLSTFWRLAEVGNSRASLLFKLSILDWRSFKGRISANSRAAYRSYYGNDPDGIFDAISRQDENSAVFVYNVAAPLLLKLGVTPSDVINRIESGSLRQAAAFGCLLYSLSPAREQKNSVFNSVGDANKLAEQFISEGYLPYEAPPKMTLIVLRRFIINAFPPKLSQSTWSSDQLDQMLKVLSKALDPTHFTNFVEQTFLTLIQPFVLSNYGSQNLMDTEKIELAVDALISNNIRFKPNSAILYALQKSSVPKEKQDLLKSTFNALSRDGPQWGRYENLHTSLINKDVSGTLTLLNKYYKWNNNSILPTGLARQLSNFILKCSKTIAESVAEDGSESMNHLKASEIEELFWASLRCGMQKRSHLVRAVALTYLKTSDIKELAGFFSRVSQRHKYLQPLLFTNELLEALLKDDLQGNLELLHKMICAPQLKLAQAVHCAAVLDHVINTSIDSEALPTMWKDQGSEHWFTKILTEYFKGNNNFTKLRIIHDAITVLCTLDNLLGAHYLHKSAINLNLIPYPQTNNLLIIAPYLSSFPLSELPKYALTHEINKHKPLNLSPDILADLDSTILSTNTVSVIGQTKATAAWLHKYIQFPFIKLSSAKFDCFPTWLVVSQRLFQSGSIFVTPLAWYHLTNQWLKLASSAVSPDTLLHFEDWFTYTIGSTHKCSMILAALNYPFSESWALERLQDNSLFFRCIDLFNQFDLSLSCPHIGEALSKVDNNQCFDLALKLSGNTPNFQEVCSQLSDEEVLARVPSIIVHKRLVWQSLFTYLTENRPSLLPTFVDHMLDKLRTLQLSLGEVHALHLTLRLLSFDCNQISHVNRAFLYSIFRYHSLSSLKVHSSMRALTDVLETDLNPQWLDDFRSSLNRRDFIQLSKSLTSLDETLRMKTLTFACYTLLSYGVDLWYKQFLLVLAQDASNEMLQSATELAKPFLRPGTTDAFMVLVSARQKQQISWMDRALLNLHKLTPFVRVLKTPEYDTNQEKLHWSPLKSPHTVGKTLLSSPNDSRQFEAAVQQISTWSLIEKKILLSHLAAFGATNLIDKIAATQSDCALYALLFGAFSKLVSQTQSKEEDMQLAENVLAHLYKLSQKEVRWCFIGLHMGVLLRVWPTELLDNLLKIVFASFPAAPTVCTLRLGSVCINRGRSDLIEKYFKFFEKFPLTLLCGNYEYVLSPDEVNNTMNYLQKVDPSRVQRFTDLCLRCALSCVKPNQMFELWNLIRTFVSEPHCIELKHACQQPTVDLISKLLANKEVPRDILDILQSVTDSYPQQLVQSDSQESLMHGSSSE